MEAATLSPSTADGLLAAAEASASPIFSADLISSVRDRFDCSCALTERLFATPPEAVSPADLYVTPVGIGGNAAMVAEGKSEAEDRRWIEVADEDEEDDKDENPGEGPRAFGRKRFPRPKMSSSTLFPSLPSPSPPLRTDAPLEPAESDARGEV